MKDYLGVYIKFLIVLGALLIGGLLLQSLTSGQSRWPRDETAEFLRRKDLRDRQEAIQQQYGKLQHAANQKAAKERQAQRAHEQGLQWETVTVRMRRYGYERELVEQEMADLEKLMGGKLAPKSLERCEDGVYKATFQWVSP